jgi:hypothetical protein
MGKFQGTGYINPLSAKLTDRGHTAPTAAKAQAPKLEPAAKVERPANARESRVSHAAMKDPTAAVRRARWRKKNPEQHADQQRAARARRKAGKATA